MSKTSMKEREDAPRIAQELPAMVKLHEGVIALHQAMKRHQIVWNDFILLRSIGGRPGIDCVSLKDALRMSEQTVAPRLLNLRAKGLLFSSYASWRVDHRPTRRAQWNLTEKGLNLVLSIFREAQSLIN